MLLRMQVRHSSKTPLLTCLLEGRPGVGKTALAATVGINSDFPFVKVSVQQASDAMQTPLSVGNRGLSVKHAAHLLPQQQALHDHLRALSRSSAQRITSAGAKRPNAPPSPRSSMTPTRYNRSCMWRSGYTCEQPVQGGSACRFLHDREAAFASVMITSACLC